ncbi:hypothetical protein GCM10027590_68370 [Nocardiopsis nanhaiensis]
MNILVSLLAVFARLFRPSQGVHVTPFGYIRELLAEVPRRRSPRVRPYVADAPHALPPVPSPRRPVDALPRTALSAARPVVDPRTVAEPAALVRGHYVAHERREAQRRTDRDRLGIAVLTDIAAAANRSEVSA